MCEEVREHLDAYLFLYALNLNFKVINFLASQALYVCSVA
jgi:hypothetical protein